MSQIRDNTRVRPSIFHPQAREAIREFPEDVRKVLGKAIFDLQCGHSLGFPLSRPMPSVGPGVEELRIRDSTRAFRVFYLLKSSSGVFVFHAFIKKTRATPRYEIEVGARRLRELIDEEN
jgi:phage-related protein